jgi:hypothetical protein
MPTLQQQLQPRPRLPGEEGEMSDEELCKRLRGWGMKTPSAGADRIEALTEQLEQLVAINEAARADAKEAEAYAEELAGDQVDLCRQLIAAEDKLEKAVEFIQEVRRNGDTRLASMAIATLAEIEGGKG